MSVTQEASSEVLDSLDALDTGPDAMRIAGMGHEVVGAVQMIRDMLKARAEVLESCRSVLLEQHAKMVDQRQHFEQEQVALCDEYDLREAELSERERAYEGVDDRVRQLTEAFEVETLSINLKYEEIHERSASNEARAREVGTRERNLDELEKDFSEQKAQFEARIASLDADREKLRVAGKQLGEAKARFLKEHDDWDLEREQHAQVVTEFEQRVAAQTEAEAEFHERVRNIDAQSLELGRREASLRDKEGTLELRLNQVEKQKEELLVLRRRWEDKMGEINEAGSSLASLQEQLAVELGHISTDRSELLERFGLSDKGWSNGQAPEGGIPASVEQPTSSAAVERYQKLCRDARRRAIGAV